jgi:hypothetical protein
MPKPFDGYRKCAANDVGELPLTPDQIEIRRKTDNIRTLLKEMDASYEAWRASITDEEYEQCLKRAALLPIDLELARVLKKARADTEA